jgi:hypothetical protein
VSIVIGILLIGAGAILVWVIDGTVGGVATSTIGVLLIAIGAIGAAASELLAARTTSGRMPSNGQGRDPLGPVEVEAPQEEETPPFGHR